MVVEKFFVMCIDVWTFCLGTEVPRHSAGSVGMYNRWPYVCTLYVNYIHNQRYCFTHARAYISHVQNSIANKEFPVSIQVQGCGETGLLHTTRYNMLRLSNKTVYSMLYLVVCIRWDIVESMAQTRPYM